MPRVRASVFLGLALAVMVALPGGGCGSSTPRVTPPLPDGGPTDATTGDGPALADDGEAGPPPLELHAPALIPVANRLDASSSAVVFDALRGRVWTANGDVGSISYVDIDA